MPDFAYRAIDPSGDQKLGRVIAANENDARQRLERKQLYILDLGEANGDHAPLIAASRFSRRKRLKLGGLSLFTRQLATLVQVSPIGESLSTIARQTEKPAARAIVSNVYAGVQEGESISTAMAREGSSFDPLFRAIVSAGDASGTLSPVLERLADLLERRAALRGRVVAALAYPAILAIVAVFVVVALMIFVVPRMVEQFDTVGQQLPLLTRIIIGISNVMRGYWWVFAGVFVLGAVALWQGLTNEALRLRMDRRLLRLPIAGRLIRDVHAASFARNLSTMVAARLPLVEGLALAKETVGNRALRLATGQIIEAVRGGGSLSRALQASGMFPPLLVYLTASGESSGRLDTMLERAAEYLEREFDSKSATAIALLEPAVIVIMGVVVALIVLSVLLPILQLESLAAI
jgi:general secretion pathway protein F